jgi:hypothetical protein
VIGNEPARQLVAASRDLDSEVALDLCHCFAIAA